MKTNVHVCRKRKYNQRPCNANGLELQCNLYGKNIRTRCLILAIVSHYMYLEKNRSYEDVKEKNASFCIEYELLVIYTRYL